MKRGRQVKRNPRPMVLGVHQQFGISLEIVLCIGTSFIYKEAYMTTQNRKSGNGSSNTAIVAIVVILVIALGAYFLFIAPGAGGGGGGGNSIIPTLPVIATATM
jgi:hypothetical protein